MTTLCFVCRLALVCVEGEWILAPEEAPKAPATTAPPAKPPANAKAPPKGMDPPPPPPGGSFMIPQISPYKLQALVWGKFCDTDQCGS